MRNETGVKWDGGVHALSAFLVIKLLEKIVQIILCKRSRMPDPHSQSVKLISLKKTWLYEKWQQ